MLPLTGCRKRHPDAHPIGTPPVVLEQPHSRGETPQTPALEGEGLVFALHDALFRGERAVSLHARYRVPAVYGTRYGENVEHALYVVAVNEHNQRVWAEPVTRPAEGDTAWAKNPMADEAAPGDAGLEGTFTVDLRQAAQLPHQEAPYLVFLWLDELVSAPQHVVMPLGTVQEPPPAPLTGVIWLHEIPGPEATGPSVRMSRSATDPSRVAGVATRLPDAERQPLLIMSTTRPGLALGWNRAQFPVARGPEDHRGQNFEFDFQPKTMFRSPPTSGRVWSLAYFNGQLSSSVSVDAAAVSPPPPPAPEAD